VFFLERKDRPKKGAKKVSFGTLLLSAAAAVCPPAVLLLYVTVHVCVGYLGIHTQTDTHGRQTHTGRHTQNAPRRASKHQHRQMRSTHIHNIFRLRVPHISSFPSSFSSFSTSFSPLDSSREEKQKKRVAVIGAGAAGLTAVKNVLENYSSCFDVQGFEQSGGVGGVWSTDTMWDSLTTNLPANAVMKFRGHDYPPNVSSYVHHSMVKDYLERYAEEFSLRQHFEFRTSVVSVRPQDPGRYESAWEVQVRDSGDSGDSGDGGDSTRTEIFDAVIVSSGHFDKTYVPMITGLPSSPSLLPASVTHSKAYSNPSEFTDKVVLVVGCGASGVEICPELASVAKDVYVVAPKRQPKDEFFEIPRDIQASHSNLELIEDLVQSIELAGKPPSSCLSSSPPSFSSSPTTHRAVLHSGRVLEGIDRILFCTGYHYEYSFLHESCGVTVAAGKAVSPLCHQLWNAHHPTMCFPSLLWKALTFPLVELQIQAFLKILQTTDCFSSPQQTPEQWRAPALMARALAERRELDDLGKHPNYAHMLGVEHSDYVRTLLAVEYGAGVVPTEWQLLLDIYQEAGPAR
jgi:hypothetical protein